MMAVSVDLSNRAGHGAARELFSVGAYETGPYGNPLHDVAEDGRFLMLRSGTGARTWRWIQNWGADLDALLAGVVMQFELAPTIISMELATPARGTLPEIGHSTAVIGSRRRESRISNLKLTVDPTTSSG